MTIHVALRHRTSYRYDRPITMGPQVVRLRPAPHSRTPVLAYSMTVTPENNFLNWQQDPYGNFLARLVMPEPTEEFVVDIDVVVDMTVINPFDFFLEEYAEQYPFEYSSEYRADLQPYLETERWGDTFQAYLADVDRSKRKTIFFLVELNQKLQRDIRYLIRKEPGVQTPEETLTLGSGSCRDSAWLLVHLLRHCGLAARFCSGYLIQLAPDQKSLDGPSGPEQDFTDLHAWTEVYLPGAGWIGLDPTSGLLAGEGHIPLAATPAPTTAAPIAGPIEPCESEFDVEMTVTRVREDPRVTLPYTEEVWTQIDRVGQQVDDAIVKHDIRLTMGGEPTFVSIDDQEGDEWNTAAVGPTKRAFAMTLIQRLRDRFAPGGLLHIGQGKWYPGESLPRWGFSLFWRTDGEPLWHDSRLVAQEDVDDNFGPEHARAFTHLLAERLDVGTEWVRPAYEDVWDTLKEEQKLPVNLNPEKLKLEEDEQRRRLAKIFDRGVGRLVGCVLPVRRQWWQAQPKWMSGYWPFRSEYLLLIPGDSPMGLRLPLQSLPAQSSPDRPSEYPLDPFAERKPLPKAEETQQLRWREEMSDRDPDQLLNPQAIQPPDPDGYDVDPDRIVRTAVCVECRDGKIFVFMPPCERLDDYVELIGAVEDTAAVLNMPIVLEGYLPPNDPRLQLLKVTPDPGVIEVNVQPAHNWEELKEITQTVYQEARYSRLGTEKFQQDGRHTGTGGGNHFVLGGKTPADSPFLRRPDLLKSFVGYWLNHPSLSYLFSGLFIGPTSQAPRVDEGRRDAIYELKIAFDQVPDNEPVPPWIVDRLFRHLLVDLTGNTHRAEFCIDKLYSPDSSTGRLGLVELRGFEMPPHPRMSLAQQLLVRALLVVFWENPYRQPIIDWGTSLHDQWLLPYFMERDLEDVCDFIRQHGYDVRADWFETHREFRCPLIGELAVRDMQIELRQAIEPWYVLGEEGSIGGTARYVDSSVERLQVRVRNLQPERFAITCNGVTVPLHPTGQRGEYVAGVRYRAWQPPSCLHPTIPVHTPLTFDVVDKFNSRSLGGCQYHIEHPGGLNPRVFPVNALEAESRRAARFFEFGHTGGSVTVKEPQATKELPMTLDLRTV